MRLELFFPQTQIFEYYDSKSKEIIKIPVVCSSELKMAKRDLRSLNRLLCYILNDHKSQKEICLPLTVIVDYKGVRARVKTRTYNSKKSKKVWGYDNSKSCYHREYNIKNSVLQKFAKNLNLQNSNFPIIAEQKIQENVLNSLSPNLTIYKNFYKQLSHFLPYPSGVDPTSVWYVSELGDLRPLNLNLSYNQGLSFKKNKERLLQLAYSCSFLDITKGLNLKQSHLLKTASRARIERTIPIEIINSEEEISKNENSFINSSFKINQNELKFLSVQGLTSALPLDLKIYCKQALSSSPNISYLVDLSKKLHFVQIPKLLSYLEENLIFPCSHFLIKRAFKNFSVPMHSLGAVASATTQPNLKMLFVEEMVARSFARVCNYSFLDDFLQTEQVIKNLGSRLDQLDQYQPPTSPPTPQTPGTAYLAYSSSKGTLKQSTRSLKESQAPKQDDAQKLYIIELLKMVIIKSEETEEINWSFWNKM